MLEERLFHTVTNETKVGRGTGRELLAWLDEFVNILVPDNGIEYWSDTYYGNSHDIKPHDLVPTCIADDEENRVLHAGCFVANGYSEGRIIHISLFMRRGHRSLGWIKSFGTQAQCWEVARVITEALNHLLVFQELPRLVEFARCLPKQYRFERKTTLTDEVKIQQGRHILTIATHRQVLAQYDYTSHGDAARYRIEALIKDWQIVLTNMGARWQCEDVETEDIVVSELSGYRITNRAPGITGFYVLPPGGDANDDRDWLGYFETAASAVEAAKAHQLNTQGQL